MQKLQTLPALVFAGLFALLQTSAVLAQEERFVSDEIFIVLHAGPGSNYRWLAKLIPGTRLTEQRLSTDGNWAEVSTERGTVGWVRAEYLSSEAPAQVRLPAAVRQLEDTQGDLETMETQLRELRSAHAALEQERAQAGEELRTVTEELAQLRQVSGSAVETAENNRRLAQDVATMQTEIDTLQADNLRLQDRVRSSAFLDGSLAVLLGVIITLVVPRLWPRRRSSSSWA